MTIMQAIAQIDDKRPNSYSQEDKVKWLSTLDDLLKRTVIDIHEGYEDVDFSGYDADTDLFETELLVGSPYEEMYIVWLEAKIDYYNAEYNHYNNSITRFNELMTAFANDYNRHHKPLTTKVRYW